MSTPRKSILALSAMSIRLYLCMQMHVDYANCTELTYRVSLRKLFVTVCDVWLIVTDGEPIKLPENLESLPRADHFPTQRHRWNTNEVRELVIIPQVGYCADHSVNIHALPVFGGKRFM